MFRIKIAAAGEIYCENQAGNTMVDREGRAVTAAWRGRTGAGGILAASNV